MEEPEDGFIVEWDDVVPAPRISNLPDGVYLCSVKSIEPHKASTGTEGYRIVFEVHDGEYKGSQVPRHDIWTKGKKVTDAMRQTARRDLEFLGFKSFKDIPPIPTTLFNVTIAKEADRPLGKVYLFEPAKGDKQ